MQGSKDLPNGTLSVKVEPGTSTQRLQSLKPPRDLSLSAFSSKLVPNLNQSNKKRVYTPNLNVQRNKSNVVAVKQEPKENKPKVNSSERGREERGRGRGKKRELVQLNSGLFSESFGPSLKANRYGRSGGGGGGDASSSKSVLQKPKLNKDDNIKIDKEEEDMMLKELLRDDFIDDPNLDPDYENSPIKLPLYESNIFSKNNIKKIKTEPGVSGSGDHNCIGEPLTKIKIEPGLEENEEALEVDIRKIKIEPGLEDQQVKPEDDVLKKIKVEPGLEDICTKGKLTEINLTADKKSSLDSKKPKTPTVKEIMNSREPQFVMLQLPSCMPGLKPEVDTRQTQTPSSSSSQSNAGTSKNSNSNSISSTTEQPSNKVEADLRCTLQNLKPGKIGKMQILKSGRIRLVLGDAKLWLEMGTQVAFEQDLISVDLDRNSKTGYTICMGSVPVRMSVTPDWEQMILST